MSVTFHGRAVDPGTFGFALPPETFLATAATSGFDTVELPVAVAGELGATLPRLLAEHDLAAPLFSCPWSLPANGSVDTATFESRLAEMPALLEPVAAAGGRQVSAFFAERRPMMFQLSVEQTADRAGRLLEQARSWGMGLSVELNDVGCLRAAADVLGRVPGLNLLLDTFHYWRAGLDAEWFATLPQDAIGWVHLSGVPRGAVPTDDGGPRSAPGEGDQDLSTLLQCIGARYRGPLSLEVIPEPPAGTDLAAYGCALLDTARRAVAAAPARWAARQ